MEKLLSNCELNKYYVVSKIREENSAVGRRLCELGFYVGSKVKVKHFSALKKTLLVEVQSCLLSLRRNVADLICVKKL